MNEIEMNKAVRAWLNTMPGRSRRANLSASNPVNIR